MYDLGKNVNSYYFALMDESGNDAGYIIIGSNVSVAPVIEYATSGSFYPIEAMEQVNADFLYYTGGIDYLISNGEIYMDVSNFGEIVDATDKVNQCVTPYSIEDFSEEWKMWVDLLEQPVSISNPPTSGGAITKPDSYENGYQTMNSKNIIDYDLSYKLMNDFKSYSNHCSPTAAANIMYYWYNKNSVMYGKLCMNGDDSTWTPTFERLYSLMETDPKNGTLNANLEFAYKSYFRGAEFFNSSVTFYSSASWDKMKFEIDNNYPFHMIVQKHYYYGDHSVVGIGYEEYMHNAFSYSRYIRVVDGLSSSNS